jgi:DNA invertase Pin-like site-specific DNA recombinase
VFENTESTKRQYALRQRAIALGWPQERIEVIDTDLGQSATSAVDRQGFQKLVAEVGLGRAGIVMGPEGRRKRELLPQDQWHHRVQRQTLARVKGHHVGGRDPSAQGTAAWGPYKQSSPRGASQPAACRSDP